LETVVRCRRDLDRYEAAWASASEAVRRERQEAGHGPAEEPVEEWLAGMGEADLRRLVGSLPTALFKRLRLGATKEGE
jgi:hypothetical protein